MCDGDSTFCRVLEPVDPWRVECSEEVRAANFRGRAGRTSVANQETCPPRVVMAAFYGSSRRLEPSKPACMAFRPSEVAANGGRLEKSDADPPWPPEYNDAHHEITQGEDSVALFMARAFAQDESRLIQVEREEHFAEVCALLSRPDAHKQLVQNSSWRLRKLFKEERSLWDSLAARFPRIRDDQEIVRQLRREQQTI